MADWYALRDPRQYYYATYNIARSAFAQAADKAFAFVEERKLVQGLPKDWAELVAFYLLPLRHYEWGANMNAFTVADLGWGTALTSAAAFSGADRLGLAQHFSRIGLALDGGAGTSLLAAKQVWLDAPEWQPARKLVEDSFVVGDWFELFVAQYLAFDGIFHPLVFERFDAEGSTRGAFAVSLLMQPVTEWAVDHTRWVDAVVKIAAAESTANRDLLLRWFRAWTARATEAALPLAKKVLGAKGVVVVEELHHALEARAKALGLQEA
jgi:phenol hydroxylase P1 protein